MTLPGDEAGWRALIRSRQGAFGEAMVEAADGASLYRRDGIIAEIFPAVPERSVFNSVFYGEPAALIGCLDEVAAAYEDAGVRAWTVWAPEADAEAAAALEAAGHKLDAKPHDMAAALSEVREPEPEAEESIREDYDLATMARLNEVAYGYPPGEFGPVEQAPMSDLRVYFADLDGEAVSTLGIWARGGDALVAWVATLPEARGPGISTRLLARALADAREQGLETTTLQATKLGAPVYLRLGYRDFGAMHMWERRAEA